jgi:uncharacterized peroxidase-related enzyme
MPHVNPLSKIDAPQAAKDLLEGIENKFGSTPNIFATLAHQPEVLRGVVAIDKGLHENLPESLRELAYYKSSQLNQCEYCSHHHKQAARKAGVRDEQLAAIDSYQSSDLFSEAEKHVLRFAEQLTKTGNVDAETVQAVKSHLSDKELVTLSATVALANFTNRFNHGLAIDLP